MVAKQLKVSMLKDSKPKGSTKRVNAGYVNTLAMLRTIVDARGFTTLIDGLSVIAAEKGEDVKNEHWKSYKVLGEKLKQLLNEDL